MEFTGTKPMSAYEDFPPRRRAPQPQSRPLPALLLILLAVALAAGGIYVYRHWLAPDRSGIDPTVELRPVTPRGELPGAEQDRVQILARVKPSVVFITTFQTRRSMFSSDISTIAAGEGSGFVWDKQGHIVTNYHVIQNADAAQVKLNDGKHEA